MKDKGFTMVEIMVVTAIIIILVATAIPNLLRARLNAREGVALETLKAISNAANMYRSVNNRFPDDLSVLAGENPPYIDTVLGNGTRGGYSFGLEGEAYVFTATARPELYSSTGIRSFFVDQSGVVRWTDEDMDATGIDVPLD